MFVAGRLLKVGFNLKSLIGVGTAICGGSAIAAVAPIIEAEDQEIAYAISTVFLFNVVAVFIFPALGHALGLTQMGFGLFAGTAINDTSSVVAAGYTFGNAAGDYATIVKLTRTIMIVPIALGFVALSDDTKETRSTAGAECEISSGKNISMVYSWISSHVCTQHIGSAGHIDDCIPERSGEVFDYHGSQRYRA